MNSLPLNSISTSEDDLILEKSLEELSLGEDEQVKKQTTSNLSKPQKNKMYLHIFGTIIEFVNALSDTFGQDFKEIQLYSLLLQKTGLIHTEQIQKHVDLFKTFVLKHKEAIINRKLSEIQEDTIIRYSEKVFINMKNIIEISNCEQCSAIEEHLLLFHTLFCSDIERSIIPSTVSNDSLMKENLTSSSSSSTTTNTGGLQETNFIGDIFKIVNSTIDNSKENNNENIDPSKIMNEVMNSGVLTNLMESMQKNLAPKRRRRI